MTTPWKQHVARWKGGCGSDLCSEVQHVCLARGIVPCDILFVGEAPSIAADCVGEVFTGEIRAIMDPVIKEAGAEDFKHAYTNLVCCVPRDPERHSKSRTPSQEEIVCCRQRLHEFIELAKPRLIMAVGHYAQCALREMQHEGGVAAAIAGMPHPAMVLYARPYGGYEFRRLVDAIKKAIEEHLTGSA